MLVFFNIISGTIYSISYACTTELNTVSFAALPEVAMYLSTLPQCLSYEKDTYKLSTDMESFDMI